MRYLSILCGLLLLTSCARPVPKVTPLPEAQQKAKPEITYVEFKNALSATEQDPNNPKDGDAGLAIGPFQIHHIYWADAITFDTSLTNQPYEACRTYSYASQVVDAYLWHYGSNAVIQNDWKTLARIHNGGPKGASKESTLSYWEKVKINLNP